MTSSAPAIRVWDSASLLGDANAVSWVTIGCSDFWGECPFEKLAIVFLISFKSVDRC